MQVTSGGLSKITKGVEETAKSAETAVDTAQDTLTKAEKAVKQAEDAIAAGGANAQQATADLPKLKQAAADADTDLKAARATAQNAKKAVEKMNELVNSNLKKAALRAGGQQAASSTVWGAAADAMQGSDAAQQSNTSEPARPSGKFTYFNFMKYKDNIQAADCATQMTYLGYA